MTETLLVLGTGSLAGSVCRSLAALAPEPLAGMAELAEQRRDTAAEVPAVTIPRLAWPR